MFLPAEISGPRKGKDVEATVRSFYEETPFPNYEVFENTDGLLQKAEKNLFIRLLDQQVPFNIKVLEVGCGTGQLTNFLGIGHRVVFGTDMCMNSLKLAQGFKVQNNLERVGFYQMNLFKPIFREESFSLVICSGVLHHTGNPLLGFQTISRLVKKGGYIIIGLYNTYGRLITDMRRVFFRISRGRFKFLDPRLQGGERSDLRNSAWFKDQYKNPHESKHTIDEVLGWFEKNGFDFINGIPKTRVFEGITDAEKLFRPNPRGSWFDHLIVQASLVFTGSREGGLFLMIGKRRADR